MSLNIKNEEAERLVRQLAAATGESVTLAITVAVRERLERVTHEAQGRADFVLQLLGQDRACRLVPDKTSGHPLQDEA